MVKKKKPKRAGVYIRESTEEQDKGFSPKNQENMIRKYSKREGIEIVEFYKDLLSGRNAQKRDEFQRMINDAMQHKFDVILIFHTSRFARNVKEARHYKELLRKKLNIDVISVTQYFGDWEDPNAFLNEGVNELFDEHTSRQISFWVRSSLMEKRSQGYQNGNPPLGYYKKQIGFDKDKDRKIYDKQWLVHPEESKLVLRMYKMYAGGNYSYSKIVKELRAEGIKTKYGNPFTYSTVKDVLGNRVYLGYVCSMKKKNLPDIIGKHPSIIDQDLFDRVQEIKAEKYTTTGRPVAQHRFYLLQGLVYCYQCRKYLEGKEDKPKAKLVPKMYCRTSVWEDAGGDKTEKCCYACKLRKELNSCKQEYVECHVIDKQVMDYMEGFILPEDIIQMALDRLGNKLDQVSQSNENKKEVQKLLSKKKKLTFLFTETEELDEQDYLEQIRELDKQLKSYKKMGVMDERPGMTKNQMLEATEKFLKDFRKFWNLEIGDDERKNWVQMTIKRVWVNGQKVVAIEPKDDFKPLFASLKKVIVQAPSVTLTKNELNIVCLYTPRDDFGGSNLCQYT